MNLLRSTQRLHKANIKYYNNQSIYQFSRMSEFFRKWLNRIRFQDNRQLTKIDNDKLEIQVMQTPKQVQEKFIQDEQYKSIMERQRMQRIDRILGTKTFYHETKIYQEKLDSDHIMDIQDLKRKHKQPTRQDLNAQNPQIQPPYKIKHKRKHYKSLKNISTFISSLKTIGQYPQHNNKQLTNHQLNNQTNPQTIQFLAKQTLFTQLSLKWADLTMKSIQQQQVEDFMNQLYSKRYSQRNVYFSQTYFSSLYRIEKQYYNSKLLTDVTEMQRMQSHITQILSMDQLYEVLSQYYHDERVSQWLKKVQNDQIQYLISGYQVDTTQTKFIFWIDLLGNKKQYVFLYKSLSDGSKLSKYGVFNCQPDAVFSSNSQSVYFVQRSQQGVFVELIRIEVDRFSQFDKSQPMEQPEIVYRCQSYEEMELFTDQNNYYIYFRVRDVGQRYREAVMVVDEGGEGSGDGESKRLEIKELVKKKDSFNDENVQRQQEEQEKQKHSQDQKLKETTKKKKSPTTPPQQTYRTFIDWCSKGLILMKIYPVKQNFLKYGQNVQYSNQIYLIPYKQHIQIVQQQSTKINLEYQLPHSTTQLSTKIPFSQLQLNKPPLLLYQTTPSQIITQISVRSTHIIVNLSAVSVYNRKSLHFVPFSNAKKSHTLLFNCMKLNLISFGYEYGSQVVEFALNKSSVLTDLYSYTIWKKQISDIKNEKIHSENVKINDMITLNMTYAERYFQFFSDELKELFRSGAEGEGEGEQQQSNFDNNKVSSSTTKNKQFKLPILILLQDNRQPTPNTYSLQHSKQINLRKLLQKGTIIITIQCRGTLSTDLVNFHQGSNKYIENYFDDLVQAIQWIGNQLSDNISLYGKGNVSGLMGMLLNIRYPYLFNSTVLHNGVYDLVGVESFAIEKNRYFMEVQGWESKYLENFWKRYSPCDASFKHIGVYTQKEIQEEKDMQRNKNMQQEEQKNQENQEQISIQLKMDKNQEQTIKIQVRQQKQKQEKKQQISHQQQQHQQQPQQKETNKNKQSNKQKISSTSHQIANKNINDEQLPPKFYIGTIQNLVISCSPNTQNKIQARKMIYHLRQNKKYQYSEVYLKEFEPNENEELFNLAFLYGKMRERMQQDNKKIDQLI